jgi:hypothetical protein
MHVPFVLYVLLRHRSLRATITTPGRERTANYFLKSVRTFFLSISCNFERIILMIFVIMAFLGKRVEML